MLTERTASSVARLMFCPIHHDPNTSMAATAAMTKTVTFVE